jgi:hypothetical protein
MEDIAHDASSPASPKPFEIAAQQASGSDSPDKGKLRVRGEFRKRTRRLARPKPGQAFRIVTVHQFLSRAIHPAGLRRPPACQSASKFDGGSKIARRNTRLRSAPSRTSASASIRRAACCPSPFALPCEAQMPSNQAG